MEPDFFRIVHEGSNAFLDALALLLKWTNDGKRSSKITHYTERDGMLTLYWADPRETDAKALPFAMTTDAAARFCADWLAQAPKDGPEPDTDGSIGDGWEINTGERWGHAAGSPYGLVSVRHRWRVFGK